MKFFTSLLTVFAASSVYSHTLNHAGIFKRGVYNVGPECQQEMDTTEEFLCIGSEDKLTINTYKTVCPTILSEKCKKFYENPLSYFPKCKNEKDFQPLASPEAVNLLKTMAELKCSTDGDGKICPAAEMVLKTKNFNENAVMNSCKSKKCFTALDNVLGSLSTDLNKAVDQNVATKSGNTNVFGILKAMLNDSTCTSQTKDDTATDTKNTANAESTSGASSSIAKFGSSIILAIAISAMYL